VGGPDTPRDVIAHLPVPIGAVDNIRQQDGRMLGLCFGETDGRHERLQWAAVAAIWFSYSTPAPPDSALARSGSGRRMADESLICRRGGKHRRKR
jgi:hypothetical protein